ncbi:MAG: TonB-dependent receptor [Alphaproteobacteria bacterium]|nr:TonB-dependent receptor [Alphaproteobacteria bacterium]
MTPARSVLWPIALAAGLGLSVAQAQQPPAQPIELPNLIIGADRTPVPFNLVNASVTVVNRDEIERRQWRTLTDVLSQTPGVTTTNSGGPGKTTQLFMRGMNANHSVVLIDGVRVDDPSSVNGAMNLAHFRLEGVERIEVVRGPMSTLYGSDALGGVINIITNKGSGRPMASLSVEGGSFGTVNVDGMASGAFGRVNAALGISGTSTAGFSAVADGKSTSGAPVDDDGYRNISLNGRLGFDVTDWLKVQWLGRYGRTRTSYDNFLAEDPNIYESTRWFSSRVQADIELWDGRSKTTLAWSYLEINRRDADEPDPFNFVFAPDSRNRGRRMQLEATTSLAPFEMFSFVAGFEARRDSLLSENFDATGVRTSTVGAEVWTRGVFLNARFTPADGLSFTAGARLEHHDTFGTAVTWRLGASYLVKATDTKLRASVGTAFKAPSLDQLYVDFPAFGFFANRNLRPERSTGFEVGFDQKLFGDKLAFGATVFHNDVSDLIGTTSCGVFCSTLTNVAQARVDGVELTLDVRPWSFFNLHADYTFTNAHNLINGGPLLARPRNQFNVNANVQPLPGWWLGLGLSFRSGRFETDFSTFPSTTVAMQAYTVLRATTSYDVTPWLQVFGRVENVTNTYYEEPLGFRTPRLSAYAGARVKY